MHHISPDVATGAVGRCCSMSRAFSSRADGPLTTHFRVGSGTPIVLLHGGGLSWRTWRPVLPLLAEHHDVLAVTMAGHRGGARLADGEVFSPMLLADYVERELDEAGIETAHLVGNSLGGWVALELARRGRARSVVVFSPGGAVPDHGRILKAHVSLLGGLLLALGRMPMFGLEALLMKRVARLGAVKHGRYLSKDDLSGVLADLDVGRRNLPDLLAWMDEHGAIEPLVAHEFPIRVVWARNDGVLPLHSCGRIVRERVPGAEFVVLDEIGHVPVYDDPQLVVDTICTLTKAVDGIDNADDSCAY